MTRNDKIHWVNQNIDNTYDMIRGCMNRICVTHDDAERKRMPEFIVQYTQKLVDLTQCRTNKYENLDQIYEKYHPKRTYPTLRKNDEPYV